MVELIERIMFLQKESENLEYFARTLLSIVKWQEGQEYTYCYE